MKTYDEFMEMARTRPVDYPVTMLQHRGAGMPSDAVALCIARIEAMDWIDSGAPIPEWARPLGRDVRAALRDEFPILDRETITRRLNEHVSAEYVARIHGASRAVTDSIYAAATRLREEDRLARMAERVHDRNHGTDLWEWLLLAREVHATQLLARFCADARRKVARKAAIAALSGELRPGYIGPIPAVSTGDATPWMDGNTVAPTRPAWGGYFPVREPPARGPAPGWGDSDEAHAAYAAETAALAAAEASATEWRADTTDTRLVLGEGGWYVERPARLCCRAVVIATEALIEGAEPPPGTLPEEVAKAREILASSDPRAWAWAASGGWELSAWPLPATEPTDAEEIVSQRGTFDVAAD